MNFPQNVVWEMKYPNFDIVGRYTGGNSIAGGNSGYGSAGRV